MPINSQFFDLFPKVDYDVRRVSGSSPETVPDIFFRLAYFKNMLNNITAYDTYRLEEGDTPEIVASKVYDDVGAAWMIIYANKIFDPQFDWPLTDSQFESYIINKYGSVENAKTTIKHIVKTVNIENVSEDTTHTTQYIVSLKRYTDNKPNVPFDYWAWNQEPSFNETEGVMIVSADSIRYTADNLLFNVTADLDDVLLDGGLAQRSFSRVYSLDNTLFKEYTTGEPISVYDYEMELNENRKFIKVIKKTYYNQVIVEFKNLAKTAQMNRLS